MRLRIPKLAITDVYRLGKVIGNRLVIIKLIAVRWMTLVFSKILELRKNNLSIANDRSIVERDERRLLVETMQNLQKGVKVVTKGN